MSWFDRIRDRDNVQRERVVASTTIRGYAEAGGGETVVAGLPWRSGELTPEAPSTMGAAEVEEHRWFGSYELTEPGR